MPQIKAPNGFERLLLDTITNNILITGEDIYSIICKTLGDKPIIGRVGPIKEDLDFLVENQTIARYIIEEPENARKEIRKCSKFVYSLPKID